MQFFTAWAVRESVSMGYLGIVSVVVLSNNTSASAFDVESVENGVIKARLKIVK